MTVEYPLVTHDPNMLKKKSRGNLVGKSVSSRTEIPKFLLETVRTVPDCTQVVFNS